MLKRVLCALLASMMLVGTLAACGEVEEPVDTGDTQASSDTVAGSDETEEDTRVPLDVPALNEYKGKTITFLTRDESEWTTTEIYAQEMTDKTDNINNTVYERNKLLEQTYGVTILEMQVETGKHQTSVETEVLGGNGEFQAIISSVANSTSFSTNAYLRNLLAENIEHLDFTQSWWDNEMAEGMTIHDRLYFATGDLLTADNDATFVLLFNKTIAEDNQLGDLYSLVENNEWTMQKFYDLSLASTEGGDKLSYDQDGIGFAYTNDAPYCFLFGGGITIVQKDETDTPVYSMDMERASNISDMGKNLFNTSHALCLNDAVDEANTIMQIGQTAFGENHAMFLGEVMQSVTRMRSYDVDFGILPFPKYDAGQDSYYSMMHTTASVVSIPVSVRDEKTLDLVTAMIEAMAYHSVDTLTYTYYELNLKTRDSKDVQSGPMMDMILSSRLCDLSYYYGWSSAYANVAGTLLPTSNTQVSSLHQKMSKRLNSTIEDAVEAMDEQAAKLEDAS